MTLPPKSGGELLQQEAVIEEEMDTDTVTDDGVGDLVERRERLDTFFSSGDVHYSRQFKVVFLQSLQSCVY